MDHTCPVVVESLLDERLNYGIKLTLSKALDMSIFCANNSALTWSTDFVTWGAISMGYDGVIGNFRFCHVGTFFCKINLFRWGLSMLTEILEIIL